MATIFCFTSTGNSLYAAKKLAAQTGGSVRPMNGRSTRTDDDLVGFVFPVYFWGLPRMVEHFVSKVQITNTNAYVFAVATSGGPGFGVLGRLKELLHSKGIRLQYGARIVSTSNYLPEFSPKDSDNLRLKTDQKIAQIANEIMNRKSKRIRAVTFLNRIVYRLFPNESCDQYFTVAPTCIGCGVCKKVCPARNIEIDNGKPDFHHKCEHCLGCVHNCPSHAIDWKHKTEGKDRYRNSGVSLEDLIAFNNMEVR